MLLTRGRVEESLGANRFIYLAHASSAGHHYPRGVGLVSSRPCLDPNDSHPHPAIYGEHSIHRREVHNARLSH